jgi:hypothetical protein
MMTDKIDISPEAVERLAVDHDIVGNDPIKYVMSHPHHWKTAKTLRALSARVSEAEVERDEAQEELIAAQGQIADAEAAEAALFRVYQMGLDAASVHCEKLDLGWKDRAGLQVYPSATYCAVAIRGLTPPADLVQQATKGGE